MVFGPDTEPPLFPAPTTPDDVRPLSLRPVARHTREGKRWNEFIARYHYLGYKALVGAQMRYAVHDRHGAPLARLGFSTAARKLAPRDSFIGWTPQLREKNLPLVVDNPRFLILPWITIPNLGSHILSLVRRQLPEDWTGRYNTTPVLIETFVETPRFTGALYKASGWTLAGDDAETVESQCEADLPDALPPRARRLGAITRRWIRKPARGPARTARTGRWDAPWPCCGPVRRRNFWPPSAANPGFDSSGYRLIEPLREVCDPNHRFSPRSGVA